MQIKIEIDVKPEELRRFLGLPDVAGLQDDVVRFLREKVNAAGEGFDASGVVQNSIDLIRRNPAFRLLRGALTPNDRSAEVEIVDEPVAKPRKRKAAAAKNPAGSKRAAGKKKKSKSVESAAE